MSINIKAAPKMPIIFLISAALGVGGGIALHDVHEKVAANEGFTDVAVQPVPGDRWTIGFGTTVYADGAPVKQGDTITKKQAIYELVSHTSDNEKKLLDSLPGVELSKPEFDEYIDFIHNFGIGNWRGSSMRKHLLAGDYIAACSVLPEYRIVRKQDCSLRENQCGSGQDCRGVWDRQVDRYRNCMLANGVEPDPSIRKSEPCPKK